MDPDSKDFHLAAGSPAIDAADNTAVPKGIDTDLDGNPRFVDDPDTEDTGFGDPPIVDMGAYEFQPALCPADLDDSGDVGVKDLLILLGTWGPCPKKGDCPADFDGDGNVGVKDLLILLGNWGGRVRSSVANSYILRHARTRVWSSFLARDAVGCRHAAGG